MHFNPATGLYDDRARPYDPALERFIGRDPAVADENLYRYCAGDPATFVGHPFGRHQGDEWRTVLWQGAIASLLRIRRTTSGPTTTSQTMVQHRPCWYGANDH